jgi:CheY-like chemotaxis protein
MEPLLLVVDDDLDDLEFIRDTIRKIPAPPNTLYFTNGEELLHFLSGRSLPLKHIFITLDINLPGLNGIELLAILKKNPNYKDIPVSMVTTSSLEDHKNQSKEFGAKYFFTKPVSPNQWQQIFEFILKR